MKKSKCSGNLYVPKPAEEPVNINLYEGFFDGSNDYVDFGSKSTCCRGEIIGQYVSIIESVSKPRRIRKDTLKKFCQEMIDYMEEIN